MHGLMKPQHRAIGEITNNNLMTETQQIVWYAVAAGVGILLGVAGSIWIDVLVKRSRVLVFGWLDREQTELARLSVYVKNESLSTVEIREAGALMKNGKRLPFDPDAAQTGSYSRSLPVVLEPTDVVVVCVMSVEGHDVIDDVAACYVVRSEGKSIKGPVFQHGHAQV